jgi:TetR/AcrR family acrAB operon transcriptional repressor
MARRTKEEALATRDSLLDAAERVFGRRGVSHTTLDEVAIEAGVTRGALYWHFGGKEELFRAMCERAVLPLEQMLEQTALRRHRDPLGALAAVSVTALRNIARTPRTRAVLDILFHRCESGAECPDNEARAVQKERSNEQCTASVERLLRQAVRAGQLPPDTDIGLAAYAVNAYFSGVVQQWVSQPSACDLESVAPALVGMMIAGLSAAPPRRTLRASAAEPRRAPARRAGAGTQRTRGPRRAAVPATGNRNRRAGSTRA